MALSSDWKKQAQTSEDLEDSLEALEKLLERTKVMFEQYFMGIQRVAPTQLHRDVERRIRELTQHQIRNTGLRFRLTTLTQKFGSYNSYWKRTLREIESGRYVRDLAKVKRKAELSGEDLPDELLAKLPKLAQDRIRRERARVAERAAREADARGGAAPEPAPERRAAAPARGTVHEVSEEEAGALFGAGDLDIDELFGALTSEAPATKPAAEPAAKPEAKPEAKPAAKPEAKPAAKPAAEPAAEPAPTAGQVTARPLIPRAVLEARASQVGKPAAPRPPVPPPIPRPPTPPPIRPTAPPLKPAGAPTGMSEREGRELYARYNKAREMVGDRSEVSYDKLMASLDKQAPAIMKQHGARAVEWQVVVRGEKVILKAKPVK